MARRDPDSEGLLLESGEKSASAPSVKTYSY